MFSDNLTFKTIKSSDISFVQGNFMILLNVMQTRSPLDLLISSRQSYWAEIKIAVIIRSRRWMDVSDEIWHMSLTTTLLLWHEQNSIAIHIHVLGNSPLYLQTTCKLWQNRRQIHRVTSGLWCPLCHLTGQTSRYDSSPGWLHCCASPSHCRLLDL